MKRVLTLVPAVLLGLSLTACGGSDDSSAGGEYCKEIKAAASSFSTIAGSDVGKIEEVLGTFHDLAAVAPKPVKDDWKTVDGAITGLETALDDAGVKLADLGAGEAPDLDEKQQAALASAYTGLTSAEFSTASAAIEKHAKSECKVDLSKPATPAG